MEVRILLVLNVFCYKGDFSSPLLLYGDVAQLARAFGSYPKGRGFDPLRRYHKRLVKLKTINKICDDADFMKLANKILNNGQFKKIKHIVHHGTTRYNHSIRVAYLSYQITKIFGGEQESVVKAGILHDFFLNNYDKKLSNKVWMLIYHPVLAEQRAENYFNLTEKEKNIIKAHMFPLSKTIPKSKEAWIVALADKIVALEENAIKTKIKLSLLSIIILFYLKNGDVLVSTGAENKIWNKSQANVKAKLK